MLLMNIGLCVDRVDRQAATGRLKKGTARINGKSEQRRAQIPTRPGGKTKGRRSLAGPLMWYLKNRLKVVPKKLVVDIVVELHLGRLDDGAEETGAAVGRGLLEIGVAALDVFAEQGGGPVGVAEVVERGVDVVGKVAVGLAQVLDFGRIAVQTGLEDRVE